MPASDASGGGMRHLFFTVERRQIAYLRFTFEAYDGLVFMRTLRAADGLIEVAYPLSQQVDAELLLAALDAEVGLTPTVPPPDLDLNL